MKSINQYINEEKKTTVDGVFNMIDCMISELRKKNDKETLKSAEAFLTDYLNDLSDDDIQYIIDAYGIEDFKVGSDKKQNRQAIANYIAYKAELHKK